MKRKNIKPLIMSSLAALSLGSMSVAGTFALFTDSAETTVNIGAGEVKVSSSLTGVTLYSADASYTTGDVAGVITGDFAGTYYYKQQDGSFANGGSASVTGSTLSIERMSPGDKVVTSLGFVNDSNVNIKYRLKVTTAHEHGNELLKNLELKLFGTRYHGLKSLQTKWTEIDAGAAIAGSGIEVILPLETGNEAQAKDAEIKFTLEAVQANAEVTDTDKAEYYADAVSTTEYLAPEEITSEKKTAVAKEIEVPLSAEASEEKTVKVSVPAGAQLEDDASSLKLYVENMGEDPTYQGIAITVEQGAEIYEVTLDGLDEDNTEEITVTVDLGYEPVAVYHVHGEQTSKIDHSYDPNTGLTSFTTTNFSEFTFVRDTDIIEIPNLAKLEIVRNYVNSGHSLAGKTVKLLTDLDMNNQEWTPIGTANNPFSGVFDGDGHAIKNYKIRGDGKNVGLALFGCIKGTASTLTSVTNLSDFYSATNYTVNLPAEEIFTCVVKNLNVSGADVNTTADGWSAAVVAYAEDATISNIHLSNSVLTANEKVGGIVGFLPDNYACYITNCDTSSNVTVTTSTGNHSAGILGRVNGTSSRGIIANCTNNATINCAGVNGGGIAGQAKKVLYYNNTNNGSVTGNTRAAGIATDCSGSVFINCTNNGYIKTTAVYSKSDDTDSSAGIASYLSGDGKSVIVNCHNSGTIEGNAPTDGSKIAGIVAGGVNANDKIINNSNTGTLINHAENGKVYDICNLSNVANEVTPSNLSDLNSETAKDNKYIKVNGSLVLSENENTVTFNGQEKLEFVNSPKYLTLDLSAVNKSSFVLMVNDTVVTLKNGDDNYVTISGKGNTVKVDQNETVKSLTVINDDTQSASSFNILGNATNLVLKGNGLVNGEIAANATAEHVGFSGNGTFVLTNRGTISHTTSGIYGCEHTISTLTPCNITIHNYGTIEAKVNSADIASYALLFYGGASVNLYAYNGSRIVAGGQMSAIVTNGGTQVNLYYQDGAEVTSYGSQSTYPKAFGFYCTVAKMN